MVSVPGKTVEVGLIGGSGLHRVCGDQENVQEDKALVVDPSLWGHPSGTPKRTHCNRAIILNRHGELHHVAPHRVDYRANIAAMKQLGVTDLISFCAVGSLSVNYPPGTLVLVDQYIDRTKGGRANTFFEDHGLVAHVSLAKPTCKRLGDIVLKAAKEMVALDIRPNGTLVCIDGPQYSTRAESKLYASWGGDLIGMTTLSEARLAREAEMCFVNIAMVTDFDSFDDSIDHVTSNAVLATLVKIESTVSRLIIKILDRMPETRNPHCTEGCDNVLEMGLCNRGQMSEKLHSLEKYRVLNKNLFTSTPAQFRRSSIPTNFATVDCGPRRAVCSDGLILYPESDSDNES